jgi:hypothetical protein
MKALNLSYVTFGRQLTLRKSTRAFYIQSRWYSAKLPINPYNFEDPLDIPNIYAAYPSGDGAELAEELDSKDTLSKFRDQFLIPSRHDLKISNLSDIKGLTLLYF